MYHWFLVLFSLIITSILFFEQYYLYRKFRHYLLEIKAKRWQLIATLALFIVFNLPLLGIAIWRPRLSTLPYWFIVGGVIPFYIWHATLVFLFLILMLGKLIKLPVVSAVWLQRKLKKIDPDDLPHEEQSFPYNKERRAFLQKGIMATGGVTFAGTLYGTLRRNDYEIIKETIAVKNLPKEFEGFTITLFSDVHSSVFMWKERMHEYSDVIQSLGSDVILGTGDFVTMQLEEIYPFAEAFEGLKAPYGVYGVLGNHDFYTRQVDGIAKEVNSCGIRLLRNESVTFEKNGATLHLLGVDDIGTHDHANNVINHALENVKDNSARVLMCHRPYFFDLASRKGINLTLSGHTHGGQIVLMRTESNVLAPARVASPYVAGLYTIEENKMYVNKGLGTVGIPVRINCPPEITKLTLVPA